MKDKVVFFIYSDYFPMHMGKIFSLGCNSELRKVGRKFLSF